MTARQKGLMLEAIRVHDEEVKFAEKLLYEFHKSISPGSNILLEQIEIILSTNQK